MKNEVEYLESVIKPLVNIPEDVKVTRVSDDMGILLTVTANPVDVPILIGKEGRMALALRVIIRSFAARIHARLSLRIQPTVGKTERQAS